MKQILLISDLILVHIFSIKLKNKQGVPPCSPEKQCRFSGDIARWIEMHTFKEEQQLTLIKVTAVKLPNEIKVKIKKNIAKPKWQTCLGFYAWQKATTLMVLCKHIHQSFISHPRIYRLPWELAPSLPLLRNSLQQFKSVAVLSFLSIISLNCA